MVGLRVARPCFPIDLVKGELMNRTVLPISLVLVVFAFCFAWFGAWGNGPSDVPANPIARTLSDETGPAASFIPSADPHADDFVPVDNMHHFMEYICEPSFKGLKKLLANKPEDRADWKGFKNHALVLAETSALVADRVPDGHQDADQWKKISLNVHRTGTALYRSSGNYQEARKQFHLMVDQCNQCHQVFAEGKHQLEK